MLVISTPRDNNGIATLVGTLDSDGNTVTSIKVNPTNHSLKVNNDITGNSFSTPDSQRDANRVPAIWGVSSVDGITPIYIAVNSSGELLIDSS